MTANVTVNFVDAPKPGDPVPDQAALQAAAVTAFSAWARHFDYTTGTYAINVSFQPPAGLAPLDVGLDGGGPPIQVAPRTYGYLGIANSMQGIVEPAFGLDLAGRNGPAPAGLALTLEVNPNAVSSPAAVAGIVAPIERELEHGLGVFAYAGAIQAGPRPPFALTPYDGNLQFGPSGRTFNGPNAEAAYGGPVPLASGADVTAASGQAVNSTQPATAIQPLDVALLRDAGLPVLTDRELVEHQVARLYEGAFGRVADSGGLVQYYRAMQAAPSTGLNQVALALASSAEFTGRYGALSGAGFVTQVYQNALGRAPDGAGLAAYVAALAAGPGGPSRGDVLAAISDSDEARGRLSANPNVTYAATAEAQAARLYGTAFGRDPDPAGFSNLTNALVNGLTLQQAAMGFLNSPEFASKYGAAPSDAALVDALYRNALGRAPDTGGQAQYVGALASGTYSRADLLASFADSPELVNLVAQRADARDAGGLFLDTAPHLGVIPVLSGPGAM